MFRFVLKGFMYAVFRTMSIEEVQKKVDETQDLIRENIIIATKRGEDLENMRTNTDKFHSDSIDWANRTAWLKRKKRIEFCKRTTIVLLCIGFIFACVFLFVWYSSR